MADDSFWTDPAVPIAGRAYWAALHDRPLGESGVAGALGRAVVDAAAAYSERLAELWASTLQQPAPADPRHLVVDLRDDA